MVPKYLSSVPLVATAYFASATLSIQHANNTTAKNLSPGPELTRAPNVTNQTSYPWSTCCEVIASFVHLNEWWTTSYEVTVATVITNYLQYDDSIVLGNVSTMHNSSATSVVIGDIVHGAGVTTDLYGLFHGYGGVINITTYFPVLSGVPLTLAPDDGQDYEATSVLRGTEVVIDETLTITSPTAFWQFSSAGIIGVNASQASPGAAWDCTFPGTDSENIFLDGDPSWAWTTSPLLYMNATMSHSDGVLEVPQIVIDSMASLPWIVKDYPSIASCTGGPGMGEPTVHIPVNELTNTRSATIRMPGDAPGFGGSSSKPQNSPSPPPTPAPMPSPINQPTPATSPQPDPSAPTRVNSPVPIGSPAPVQSSDVGKSVPTGGMGGGISSILGNSGGTGESSAENSGSGSGSSDSGGGGPSGSGSGGSGNSGSVSSLSGSSEAGANPESRSGNGGSAGSDSGGSSSSDLGTSPGSESSGSGSSEPGAASSGSDSASSGATSSGTGGSGSGLGTGESGSGGVQSNGSNGVAPGATINLPAPGGSSIPVVVSPPGGVVFPNSHTVRPGQATTYNGIPISVPAAQNDAYPSAVIVGSGSGASTFPVVDSDSSEFSIPQSVNIGGQAVPISFAPSDSGVVLPNSVTIIPGSAATYYGELLSLAPSGSALIVGGSSLTLSSAPTGDSSSGALNIGSQRLSYKIAPSGSGIVLPNGQTLAPGSSIQINGVPVSLSPFEDSVQVGSSSIAISGPSESGSRSLDSITVDGEVVYTSYAANGAGIILPNGQTLSAGQSTMINGVPVSLAENYIVEGSSTFSLTALVAEQSTVLGSDTVHISYAPNGEGIILPNRQILHPGETTVISGTTVSLAPGGTALVVNGKPKTLHPDAFTTGVGNYIASGIGASAIPGSSTIPGGVPGSTAQAAGSGAEMVLKRERNLWTLGCIALVAAMML